MRRFPACSPGWACSLALTVLLLAGIGNAWANGRFPAAGLIASRPGQPSLMVVRATYGVLRSSDGGATWRWICESAPGYQGEEDPFVAILTSGRIALATQSGLALSADQGCDWQRPAGPAFDQPVVDVVTLPDGATQALALVQEPNQNQTLLVATHDGGASWQAVGTPLPKGLWPQTLEAAPSDPQRLYVTGLEGASFEQGVLMRSLDGGTTWEKKLVDLQGQRGDWLAAVDPKDPLRLYVRRDGLDADTLRVSKDGGDTWQDVLTLKGNLLGFALSPDGKNLAFGGTGASGGLWLAGRDDLTPVRQSDVAVRCLHWNAAGLWACGTEVNDGFTVGRSSDQGKTFQPMYLQKSLQPLDCPAGTRTAAVCGGYWPQVAFQLGVPDSPGDAVGGDTQAPAPKPPVDQGCTAGRTGGLGGPLALLAVLALAVWTGRLSSQRPRPRGLD